LNYHQQRERKKKEELLATLTITGNVSFSGGGSALLGQSVVRFVEKPPSGSL
jgi:hypothetical protein